MTAPHPRSARAHPQTTIEIPAPIKALAREAASWEVEGTGLPVYVGRYVAKLIRDDHARRQRERARSAGTMAERPCPMAIRCIPGLPLCPTCFARDAAALGVTISTDAQAIDLARAIVGSK